ncbi:DUF3885 domain-containing protein [Lentzea sp. CA-135723]|uniref:DUF3885 domain-containing protein n=1 Tax=Lentzea sp. CA-135723 TaxID=3239950 RepID=UPI003D916F7F
MFGCTARTRLSQRSVRLRRSSRGNPYDGGADILLPTAVDRDAVKRRHTDWLSLHPSGF